MVSEENQTIITVIILAHGHYTLENISLIDGFLKRQRAAIRISAKIQNAQQCINCTTRNLQKQSFREFAAFCGQKIRYFRVAIAAANNTSPTSTPHETSPVHTPTPTAGYGVSPSIPTLNVRDTEQAAVSPKTYSMVIRSLPLIQVWKTPPKQTPHSIESHRSCHQDGLA